MESETIFWAISLVTLIPILGFAITVALNAPRIISGGFLAGMVACFLIWTSILIWYLAESERPENKYNVYIRNLDEAQKDLDKFFIDYPEYKEIYYKEQNNDKE